MDVRLQRFYAETVGPYWPSGRALIDDAYRSLDLPFAEIQPPPFVIEVEWTLARLMDYLSTWSSMKRYQAAQGRDPLPALMAELAPGWRDPETTRKLKWPLFMRVGRR